MHKIIILGAAGRMLSGLEFKSDQRLMEVRNPRLSTMEICFPIEAPIERMAEAWQEKPNRRGGFAQSRRAAKKRGRAR